MCTSSSLGMSCDDSFDDDPSDDDPSDADP